MNGSLTVTGSAPPASRLGWRDRWLIVGAFLASTIATGVITFVTQDKAAECQAIRNQRLSDVDRFRSVASEFEPLVADYMGDALRGLNTSSSKNAVMRNLRDQRARLAYVTPYLDSEGQESAKRFDAAVVNFVVEAEKNPTGINVGPLYQELNDIFASSQDLVKSSNQATGMQAIEVTTGRFWSRTFNCSDT